MTKTILTILLIVLLNVLVGCNGSDSGRGQLVPTREMPSPAPASMARAATAAEVDVVEQMSVNRRGYRQGLEMLIEHYSRTGNHMKLGWAKKELASLDTMAKYNYIIEGSVAGPNLRAKDLIPEADDLYFEALGIVKRAGSLPFIKNKNLLRQALDKYNQLIRRYPTSDKIDDAAYNAGGIYEHFKDYTIALLYYRRASQWDPETIHPARFKAAYILDKRLHRRAEALEFYRQFLKKDAGSVKQREFAEAKIIELTKGGK